jgi:diaminohydroxyphosphoribosylaminopyrimidine deaminase / 5-amino-6-(5-phosphoribosylamino)uracil reductase
MRACLRLARRGLGRTSPNPMVGAILARGERVLCTGWHRRAGAPHAEIEALTRAGGRAAGATLYVSLEPCTHQGRTPPCVPALLKSGVRRVVVGMRDPDPRVRGRGIAALRRAGVRVKAGVLEAECRKLNYAFAFAVTHGRPYVTLKAAITLDGRIATRTGDSRWITGPAARAEAHRMRARHDAVLVGARTVLRDDPRLDVRLARGRDPVRVVLDGKLRTEAGARMLRGGAPVWIATTRRAPAARARALEAAGAILVRLPPGPGGVAVRALCLELGRRGIRSLLVEGGGETAAAFLRAGCADEVVAFVAPKILGGTRAVPMVGGRGAARVRQAVRLFWGSLRRVGDAIILRGRVHGAH